MNVNLIGVPLFYGCDREGANLAPDKLREKNVIQVINDNNHKTYDCGNIYVPEVNVCEKYAHNPKMKYLKPIVDVNTSLADEVYKTLSQGHFPFIIGGDHSIGLGSICGASKYYNNLGVIWVDAHGDINTHETTESGNIHGMPLASAMGIGPSELTNLYYSGRKIKPENVFIIGARDLDKGELELIKELKLNVYSTKAVRNMGIEAILKEVMNKISMQGIKAVHLSFDIDCLDPNLVPGTGTPVLDGMSIEEAKIVLQKLAESKLVKSMDLVELNTLLDKGDTTTSLVMDLIDWTFKHFN
ncbi:MAG: arginase [Bacillota bacterium]|nr:arginase [Bacillota bacterium]